MEEYFSHKCVTSSDKSESVELKTAQWSSNNRCEYVVVQENAEANGISRTILTKIIDLVEKSKKTSKIIVFTFETTLVESAKNNSKLKHFDYTTDVDTWLNCLNSSNKDSLLEKIFQQVKETIQSFQKEDNSTVSSRPIVMIMDSLNALLQQYPTTDVVHFIKKLRKEPLVGSVIVRYNASLEKKATSQQIATDTTALVLVETASSLAAYPVLSKERRRQIPNGMDGLLLLLRQKKNGRGSESLDFFRVGSQRNQLEIIPQPQLEKTQETTQVSSKSSSCCGGSSASHDSCQCSGSITSTNTSSTEAKLPVDQDEISFNLNISEEERHAKSQVTLPYQHQGGTNAGSAGANNNLFFIDEDDPDWDDDDLDDDLDI